MAELSPQAQAVLDAYRSLWLDASVGKCLAEALRAAADQIAAVEDELIDDCWYEKKNPVRDQLLAIAAELEGADD